MIMTSDCSGGAGCAALASSRRAAAAQKPIYESAPKTVTATIEAMDKSEPRRHAQDEAGSRLHVTAPDEMEGFTGLRVGDVVSAKYFEAVAVRVARPGVAGAVSPTDDAWSGGRTCPWLEDDERADGPRDGRRRRCGGAIPDRESAEGPSAR